MPDACVHTTPHQTVVSAATENKRRLRCCTETVGQVTTKPAAIGRAGASAAVPIAPHNIIFSIFLRPAVSFTQAVVVWRTLEVFDRDEAISFSSKFYFFYIPSINIPKNPCVIGKFHAPRVPFKRQLSLVVSGTVRVKPVCYVTEERPCVLFCSFVCGRTGVIVRERK